MNKAYNIEYEDAPSGNVTFYNYKEPLMKFNAGFGFMGALVFDTASDKVQCHFCGQWFDSLAHHVRREHAMSASDYKAAVGLRESTALINEATRAKLIASGLKKRMKNLRPGRKKTMAERRRIAATLRETRLETKNERNTCPEQLLERLMRLYTEKGYVPRTKEITFYDTLRKTFGTMKRACELAGIPYRIPGRNVTYANRGRLPEGACVKLVADFYDENGRMPGHGDMPKRDWQIILRHGKMKIFKAASTLNGKYRKGMRVSFTKEELLALLVDFEKSNGRRPSSSDCKRGLLPHASRYIYYWKSWPKALKAAFKEV